MCKLSENRSPEHSIQIVFNNRLKPLAEVLLLEDKNGFIKGRSTIDNVTIVKQVIEKRKYNL